MDETSPQVHQSWAITHFLNEFQTNNKFCQEMSSVVYEVDNRVFLLGLDELYRAAMKRHERGELLDCAKKVCSGLSVAPASVPVEGYYSEDDGLTEYFLRMRALQAQPSTRVTEVEDLDAYRRLQEVTSSRLYGSTVVGDGLLPAGVDPLSEAMKATIPDWSIEVLVSRAFDIASAGDDYSLVGLAALARDPLVLTALRETAVLYAVAFGAGLPPKDPEYVWNVDDEITSRAKKFVATFNELFEEALPEPSVQNAKSFFDAAKLWSIEGRCVRIGFDDRTTPIRHYHWAITSQSGKLEVEDFWDTELWTTKRYTQDRFPDRVPTEPPKA